MRLTDAQLAALRHIREMMVFDETHNQRWPLDKQAPGAWGGTQSLRSPTVAKLEALGLIVVVERFPARYRHSHKYALTDAAREILAAHECTNCGHPAYHDPTVGCTHSEKPLRIRAGRLQSGGWCKCEKFVPGGKPQ